MSTAANERDELVEKLAHYCAQIVSQSKQAGELGKRTNNGEENALETRLKTEYLSVFQAFLYGDGSLSYNSLCILLGGQYEIQVLVDMNLMKVSPNMENEGEAQLFSAFLLIKNSISLNLNTPIEQQLTVVSLPGPITFESLAHVVMYGFSSVVDLIAQSSHQEYSEDSVDSIREKINGIARSLQNLQNIPSTPNILGTINPIVKEGVLNGLTSETFPLHVGHEVLEDPKFLNSLQSSANEWLQAAQRLASFEPVINKGTTLSEEEGLWLDLIDILNSTLSQLQSQEVRITVSCLHNARRSPPFEKFIEQTTIPERITIIKSYHDFISGVKSTKILQVGTLNEMKEVLEELGTSLRKFRYSSYPIGLFVHLIDNLTTLIRNQVERIIPNVFEVDESEFDSLMLVIEDINEKWESVLRDSLNSLREAVRRTGSDTVIPTKFNSFGDSLEGTLKKMREFRRRHDLLVNTLRKLAYADCDHDLRFLYEPIDRLNAPNVSIFREWATALTLYNQRLFDLETELISTLDKAINESPQEKLITVLIRYKPLANISPRVKSKIRDMQHTLLGSAMNEISFLEKKLSTLEECSEYLLLHDVPTISAKILNHINVQTRVSDILRNLEIIFGSTWRDTSEGGAILGKINTIVESQNVDTILKPWLASVPGITSSFLDMDIIKILLVKENKFEVKINFDFSLATLYKEVKNLIYMGISLPPHIVKVAKSLKYTHSNAVQVLELFQTFLSLSEKVESSIYISPLLRSELDRVWVVLGLASHTTWGDLVANNGWDSKVSLPQNLIKDLEQTTFDIIELFHRLQKIELKLSEQFTSIRNQAISSHSAHKFVSKVQEIISEVQASREDNMRDFVNHLNWKVVTLLSEKILESLTFYPEQGTLKIIVDNESIQVVPSIVEFKRELIRKIDDTVHFIAGLPLLNIPGENQNHSLGREATLYVVEKKIAYFLDTVDKIFVAAAEHTNKWKEHEYLWHIHEKDFLGVLKGSLEGARDYLRDFVTVRKELDYLHTHKFVDLPLRFETYDAYALLSGKYTYWKTILTDEIIVLYAAEAANLNRYLIGRRNLLESAAVDTRAIEDIFKLVEIVDDTVSKLSDSEKKITTFHDIQTLLLTLGVRLPADFLHSEQLETAESMLRQGLEELRDNLLGKKEEIEYNLQVVLQDTAAQSETLTEKWTAMQVNFTGAVPADVLKETNALKNDLQCVADKYRMVEQIGKFLHFPVSVECKVGTALDEIQEYQSHLLELSLMWDTVEHFWGSKWSELDAYSCFQKFLLIAEKSATVQPFVKRLTAFQSLLERVDLVLQSKKIISMLKDSPLKERHWTHLFQEFLLPDTKEKISAFPSFSLGDVLKLNLQANERAIVRVVEDAKREFVVEKALLDLEQFWNHSNFETIEYDDGMKLISDWDAIKQSCRDNLDEILSMKNSSYYKIFEQVCLEWEYKLVKLSEIFDDWSLLQVRWVDLHKTIGINKEIQKVLPLETAKFRGLSLELKNLSLRALHLNRIIDILSIPDLQRSLKKMLRSIKNIKSSLNEFLEEQRRTFGNFYFLGNDDFLKVISGGSDTSHISRYMRKLFVSIESLIVEESTIVGVESIEGERLLFSNSIAIDPGCLTYKLVPVLNEEIKNTIHGKFDEKMNSFSSFSSLYEVEESLRNCIFQIQLLGTQVYMTEKIESYLQNGDFGELVTHCTTVAKDLTSRMETGGTSIEMRKLKSLLLEVLHYESVCRSLATFQEDFARKSYWVKIQKFYWRKGETGEKSIVTVSQGCSVINYEFNYIGVPERLVYTPLLIRGFGALTDAIAQGLGGCFFGPAGTGKTETVKALGQNLGKMVVVFNCDTAYDFQIMTRLITGISLIGAWGCFDEFNRLEDKVLSAVSQNIELIQNALAENETEIDFLGSPLCLNQNTAIFITLNRNYLGRSRLPENLKKNFREFSILKPDGEVITKVLMRIQGIADEVKLAPKVIRFFEVMENRASKQQHYDFSLRSLKRTLIECQRLSSQHKLADGSSLLALSLDRTVLPRLSSEDRDIYFRTKDALFGKVMPPSTNDKFLKYLKDVCERGNTILSDEFVERCLQLYNMQETQQAILIVGEAGFGKTMVWRSTIAALDLMAGRKSNVYQIDTKVLTKRELYGSMNKLTLEWKDGVFSSIIRRILDDADESTQSSSHWVIFDSDLDSDYAEVLNSVFDDNKLLSLPNGDHLHIPQNIHFIFETNTIENVTPATVTRCGLLWFSEITYDSRELLKAAANSMLSSNEIDYQLNANSVTRVQKLVEKLFAEGTWDNLTNTIQATDHILGFNMSRSVSSFSSTINAYIRERHGVLEGPATSDGDLMLELKVQECLINSFALDSPKDGYERICDLITGVLGDSSIQVKLLDVSITAGSSTPVPFSAYVPDTTLDHQSIVKSDVIIPTPETERQEYLILELLKAKRAIILCGPPGSGKTMVLCNTIRKCPTYQLVSVNFSKETSVGDILRTLTRYTKYLPCSNGFKMVPKVENVEIVLFCDEINLPQLDRYGSQPVILFLRQLIEKKGFWRPSDGSWIGVERLHIVGACNPPQDAGRVPMSERFTRHATVISFDYPSGDSLMRIYMTYYKAMLGLVPQLQTFAEEFAKMSILLYGHCKNTFKASSQPHYIFSPRELTRWIRGIYRAVSYGPRQTLVSFIRIWAYEAWRIFADKLVSQQERDIFETLLTKSINSFFPDQNVGVLTSSSLLFSDWLGPEYVEVDEGALSNFVDQRFKTFCEEELDTPVITYDKMLDYVLRIDRILKQPQGHGMLIGPNRIGKMVMTKFVAWLDNVAIVEPNICRGFSLTDFDEFLRTALLKSSVEEQQVCILLDESSILDTSFVERMNTLLANSDIPDLFQGEDYDKLMLAIRHKTNAMGLLLDTDSEIYDWFVGEVTKNLHVVFILSNSSVSFSMATSPAFYNRFVVSWMNQWDVRTMLDVGKHLIDSAPLEFVQFDTSASQPQNLILHGDGSLRDVLISIVMAFDEEFHEHLEMKERSPGKLIDTLALFGEIYGRSFNSMEGRQRFINTGLERLSESVLKVRELNKILSERSAELNTKDKEARRTLDELLSQQNESERKQEATEEIRKILIIREEETRKRHEAIAKNLSEIEPSVLEAQRGVKNIKKQQLTELRSMNSPPSVVKDTLEAVCLILGYEFHSWKDIQSIIRRDEFIADIVYYRTEKMMTSDIKAIIEENYLSRDDFTYETVYRASKACGPLYQWIFAQVKYYEILHKVIPLKDQIDRAEQEKLHAKARLMAAEQMIKDLGKSIEDAKEAYTQLIRDSERIKADIKSVRSNLDRSVQLVTSLTSEKERWLRSIKSFEKTGKELIGNSLLSSVYETYFGVLNEKERKSMLKNLSTMMNDCGIRHDKNYTYTSINVSPDERHEWDRLDQLNDEFFFENLSLILKAHMHIPFIIDSESRVIKILATIFGHKFVILSFLEPEFVKRLENAMKFGSIVLIQDGEFYDPILNHLVFKEYRRVGGREQVKIGENYIDVSPEFKLFIHTKDAHVVIPNYVRCHVNVVNFSTTKESIELQAIRVALTKERPDSQEKRDQFMRLNGEYKIRLRSLEEKLLQELNNSEGNILENDALIQTLEELKEEASVIESKIKETEDFMEQADLLTKEYSLLGQHCVKLYAVVESLGDRHWFFKISVNQFMRCFELAISEQTDDHRNEACVSTGPSSVTSGDWIWCLYKKIYGTFSQNFDSINKKIFSTLLYMTYHLVNGKADYVKTLRELFDLFTLNTSSEKMSGILQELNTISSDTAESSHFLELSDEGGPPSTFIDSIQRMFMEGTSTTLLEFIGDNIGVILGSAPEVDGSLQVMDMAKREQCSVTMIPLGSNESTKYAESEIMKCGNGTNWLLIQNLQMSMSWVNSFLSKELGRLSSYTTTPGNRSPKVFMTCNLLGERLPNPLLTQCYKYVYEDLPSILDTVMELWGSSEEDKDTLSVTDNSFAYFKLLICWFHALILGRNRLAPVGFSKKYDFSDCDYQSAVFYAERLVLQRETLGDEWYTQCLKDYMCGIVYGGKTDDDSDLDTIKAIGGQLFDLRNSDNDGKKNPAPILNDILPAIRSLRSRSATYSEISQFLSEIKEPVNPSTEWLGLPSSDIKSYEDDTFSKMVTDTLNIYKSING